MNKFLSTLGLCRRAGKIAPGYDAVCEEIKRGNVSGVFTASDISDKTRKEIDYICDKYSVPHIKADVTMDEIKQVLSVRTGITAILDKGFFDSLSKSIYRAN